MFRRVTVGEGDDVESLAASGMRVMDVDGKPAFRQPCPAFATGCCSIYEHRPAICRGYRCALRKSYDAGETSFGDARSLIVHAIALRDRIRPELERLAESPGPHCLEDLYKLLDVRIGAANPPLRERRQDAEFLLNLGSLKILLSQHFELRTSDLEDASQSSTS
jgi:Fe-S-cluster containining protein